MVGDVAAVIVMGLFGVIAAIHVYWGAGGRWPGRNEAELVELVVGSPPGTKMPGLIACCLVALALLVGAALVAAARGFVDAPATWWLTAAQWGLAAVLFLRGAGGWVFQAVRPAAWPARFAKLNARLYSPLCVLLALGSAAAIVLPR